MTILERRVTDEWLERDEAVLAGVLSRVTDIVAVEGRGSWLSDVDGRRWLDFASGIAVTNIGHCHPRVVSAAQAQLGALMHTSVVTHHARSVELAERLRGLVPWMLDAQVFFCNTGAETIDGAIKMARRVTGRPNIVAFRHGFHGRTLGATSLTTAKAKYRAGYEPLLGGVTIAPYGEPDFAQLDAILATQTPAHTVAAMVVEPVLGEGGYIVPPVEWLEGLRRRCDEHGILLVFDEVQTGIGRTGRMFAAETFGVHPDVLLFAKAVASGLPLAGIIASRSVFDRWPTGTHGTTFGGNPVACAAALATLDVIEADDLCERAQRLGDHARARLGALAQAGGVSVRGVGMMIGVQLGSAAEAEAVQRACLDAGLIVLTCGPNDDVLRLMPALNVPEADLDLGLDILCAALRFPNRPMGNAQA
jgi:4-aminobutyrate aminotransferase